MPYKNPADRNVKREVELEKNRPGAHEARMERQRARRALDKKGRDANGNGKADAREGKDVKSVVNIEVHRDKVIADYEQQP